MRPNLIKILKKAEYTHCYLNPDWADFFFDYEFMEKHGVNRHYSEYVKNEYVLVLK